jgi:hypothetical protein
MRKSLTALAASLAVIGAIFAGTASSALAYGQCGGYATTANGLLAHWHSLGVTSQYAHMFERAGMYQSRDGSFKRWVRENVIYVSTSKVSTTQNYGCNPGVVFGAGSKTLPAHHGVFVIKPYRNGRWSTKRHKGWTKHVIKARIVADGSCSNGHIGTVYITIYTAPKPKPHPRPKPKPPAKPVCTNHAANNYGGKLPCVYTPQQVPPGSCNVVVIGNNNDVSACNVTIVIVCSGVNVVVGGPNSTSVNEAVKQYESSHNCNESQTCTNDSCSTQPPCNTCQPPPCTTCHPVPPSVTVTSYTKLNMVNVGKDSGPAPFMVNASDPGSVTVDPGMGGISDCSGGPEQTTPLTFNLVAGDNDECVIYYAPDDADQPQSDTITYTAIVTTDGGTAKDVKQDVFAIKYPVRP